MVLLDTMQYSGTKSPLFTNVWNRMIRAASNKVELLRGRYMLSTQSATPLITFINRLLTPISGPYLLEDIDDFTLYTRHVAAESEVIGKIIDPLLGNTYNNIFAVNIDQIIMPSSGLVGIHNLLVDESKYSHWEDVHPIHIVSYDSSELCLPSTDGRWKFTKDIPTHFVVCIDVAALMMKFIKYTKSNEHDLETVDRIEFIHREIVPYIYDDILPLWCMNIIIKYLEEGVHDVKTFAQSVTAAAPFVTASLLRTALAELDWILARVKTRKVTLGSTIHTPLLGYVTIADILDAHTKNIVIDKSMRYGGYTMLKSHTAIRLMMALLDHDAIKPLISQLIRRVEVEHRRFSRSGWFSHVRTMSERNLIERLLFDLISFTS